MGWGGGVGRTAVRGQARGYAEVRLVFRIRTCSTRATHPLDVKDARRVPPALLCDRLHLEHRRHLAVARALLPSLRLRQTGELHEPRRHVSGWLAAAVAAAVVAIHCMLREEADAARHSHQLPVGFPRQRLHVERVW